MHRLDSVATLEDPGIHPADRPSLSAVALTQIKRIRTAVDLFYTSYQVMTELPEWIPLFGCAPDRQLSLDADPAVSMLATTTQWKKAVSLGMQTRLRDDPMQKVYEHHHNKVAGGHTQVIHNLAATVLYMDSSVPCDEQSASDRRSTVRSAPWSQLNKVHFLVWMSRYYNISGDISAAAACRRAAVGNGALMPGSDLMDKEVKKSPLLINVPLVCSQYVRELPRLLPTLVHGTHPDEWACKE